MCLAEAPGNGAASPNDLLCSTPVSPSVPTPRPPRGEIAVDRLPERGPSLEVVVLEDASFGTGAERGPRRPHRHDYHELIWTRCGSGHHLIDGEVSPIAPNALTLIGRGRVHVFEHATGLSGAVVRFGDELLEEGAAGRAGPGWLLSGRGPRTVAVPLEEVGRLEATIATLAAETRRPPDASTADLHRHLLSALLLWARRWYDAARDGRWDPDAGRDAAGPDAAEAGLHRRFVDLLEHDFARHHDTRHYAEALRVPPAALSRALSQVTGRGTKELITDRRMLEAERLLRFSDLSVGEVAHRAGFGDPLYFSRAFKRHHGEAPGAYRERLRGQADAPSPA